MVYLILSYESISRGFTPETMWLDHDLYIPGLGFILFPVGMCLFLLLGIYLEYVLPQEYG
jgi:hypothetical protein